MVKTSRTEALDYGKVLTNIVNGTAKYLTDNKIKVCVLGISGGIDSTVTAAICKLVFEKIDVPLIGISLPCSTNKNDEKSAASLVGAEFCNEFKEVNLQMPFEMMEKFCAETSGTDSTPISQGNIKARLRMITLYDIASKRGGIVIDTDNLTEQFLGFWTLHGDQADFNPIGGLWKHEVYGLAKYLKSEVFKDSKALEASIALMPTDGNGVKDGGDLAQIAEGKTYDDVDDILYHWVNLSDNIKPKYASDGLTDSIKNTIFDVEDEDVKKRRLEYCEKSGKEFVPNLGDKYGVDTIRNVCMRSVRSEFKRRQQPFVVDIFNGKILEKNGEIIA